jgi:hypothetical protein
MTSRGALNHTIFPNGEVVKKELQGVHDAKPPNKGNIITIL